MFTKRRAGSLEKPVCSYTICSTKTQHRWL